MSQQRIVRISTAMLVLGLAGLGLLGSLFSVWGAFMVELPGLSPMAMLFDGLLSLVSNLGLAVVGIAFLLRVRSLSWLILGAFGISLVDSVFYWVAILPEVRELYGGAQGAFLAGSAFLSVLSVMLYIGLLALATLPWMREELGRSNRTSAVATTSTPLWTLGAQPLEASSATTPETIPNDEYR